MTAFDKKVNQIAARHGWNISPVSGWYIPAYSIVPMDRKERDQITAALNRCKGLHLETLSPLHYESWAVKICDAGQLDAWRERERQKSALVDVFYNALRTNGGDQNAAKAVQYETAVQWNAVEAFNLIYA